MDIESWLVFVLIWFLASIPLGPNALNCISTSAQEGFYKSLCCVLGITIAALIYVAIVITGFATVLLVNKELFTIVKYLGASYLIWMGVSMWRNAGAEIQLEKTQETTRLSIIQRSLVISMTNPKAIFAYGAVFSQFIDPATYSISQLLIIVPTALFITAIVYLGYCFLGLGITQLLKTIRRRLFFNRSIGSAYILGGVGLLAIEMPEITD